MMVAIFILGMVMAGVYVGLNNIQTSSVGAAERVINLDEGRVLMDTLSKDFRTATRRFDTSNPLETASWQSATFYARLNTPGQPVLVEIALDDEGRLEEKITDPVCLVTTTPCPEDQWDYDPDDARTRIVGRWVDETVPVFTYFGVDPDNGEPIPLRANPSDPTPLSDEELALVRAVQIDLKIRRSPNLGATPTTLENWVRLPNIY
jgi:hypothetical protein